MGEGEFAMGVDEDGGGEAAGVVHIGQVVGDAVNGKVIPLFGFKGFGLFKVGIK